MQDAAQTSPTKAEHGLNRIDAGAVVLSVVALAGPWVMTEGFWSPRDFAVASVVFVILALFQWPTPSMHLHWRSTLAAAVVLGFTAHVVASWPLQRVLFGPEPDADPTGAWTHLADQASLWAIIPGVLVCIAAVYTGRPWERR